VRRDCGAGDEAADADVVGCRYAAVRQDELETAGDSQVQL